MCVSDSPSPAAPRSPTIVQYMYFRCFPAKLLPVRSSCSFLPLGLSYFPPKFVCRFRAAGRADLLCFTGTTVTRAGACLLALRRSGLGATSPTLRGKTRPALSLFLLMMNTLASPTLRGNTRPALSLYVKCLSEPYLYAPIHTYTHF